MEIKDAIINKVKIKMSENEEVYVPTVISPSKHVYFAVDNSDLKIDTPDGKNQLHGTSIAIYQEKDLEHVQAPIKIDRSKVTYETTNPVHQQRYCSEPTRENKSYMSYQNNSSLL